MKPLYRKVSTQILDEIQTGRIKLGDRLPAESVYAAELGISRSTLRLALADLEKLGVISRRKRSGTHVISNAPQSWFQMATNGIDEILSLGRDTVLAISSVRMVSGDDVPQLSDLQGETGPWLEVIGSRTLPGDATPFSINRVYIPARYEGIEPLLKGATRAVFELIEQTYEVKVAKLAQIVTAVSCPEMDARQMGLGKGAPALCIDAELHDTNGRLIEVSVAIFDPTRFQVQSIVAIG